MILTGDESIFEKNSRTDHIDNALERMVNSLKLDAINTMVHPTD